MDRVELAEEVGKLNPFKPEHLDQLEEVERKIEIWNELARKAEVCGIPCITQRQTIAKVQQGLLAVKREFMQEFIDAR